MWKPRAKQVEILERAFYWMESVPYKSSTRWIFYKLYDKDHLFEVGKRQAYHNLFLPLLARARKSFYDNWRPDSLADDSRGEVLAGFGYTNEKEWLEIGIAERECVLDRWQDQDAYLEIWFEALAMQHQFQYYAPGITLVPFKGDASIEYKWRIAKRLEDIAARYDGKPIKILYFGDCDKKGLEIPGNALRDVEAWCSEPFEFVRCGLSIEQAESFGLGEAIDEPGSYQWESLSDDQAAGLISLNVQENISQGKISDIEQREAKATERFQKAIKGLIRDLEI